MEPKWNVKNMGGTRDFIDSGINGTKVECKADNAKNNQSEYGGINGTKVECKGFSLDGRNSGTFGINGTKVECKGCSISALKEN